ncbi:MAG TPA: TRAP transporter small permease [Deltaproteobacteria bacterium]|mgnify:CR=1 FL=1|nr:TRAP transporter small permease [Deltaproteobacteria bacterium]HPJ94389.1 TRAP transporter small permease [Deltaproteobacteria bacterium]HPR52168.1 TRAP transporter small permease [Deltaproteobacteria bacterium]
MVSFLRIERFVARIAERVNWVAAAAVVFMMLITTADVIMRAFRHPILGTYEIVGFTGVVVIAFSLPYTSIQKGHIAVEFLVQRLPWLARVIINIINAFISIVLFAVIAWQCAKYAETMKISGEVSSTLQMPTYPFLYGISFGCLLLCVVLFIEFLRQFRGAEIE